ncbi:MAG: tetratricopeptide repeat protein [bacterium]|nr:tetratricopeptide repeat protein [bacterium]
MRIGATGATMGIGLMVLGGCQGKTESLHRRPITGWNRLSKGAVAGGREVLPEPKLLPITHYTSAQLQESAGAYEGAINQYRKAIVLNHGFVEAYERLGILLDRLARYVEAEDVWNRAVANGPENASIRNNQGFHYLVQRHYEEAALAFEEALRIDPSFDRARMNLGIVLIHQGRFDNGLALFREVLPEADAQYNLGIVLRQKNMDRRAADAFALALEVNPRMNSARLQLSQLEWVLRREEASLAALEADRLASAAIEVLAKDGVRIESFASIVDRERCKPADGKFVENFSTDSGPSWVLPEKESRVAHTGNFDLSGWIGVTHEYVRAERWHEAIEGVMKTWPRWCPDRFDYEPTLPVGIMVRLNTMLKSPSHAAVAGVEWSDVREHMEDTWTEQLEDTYDRRRTELPDSLAIARRSSFESGDVWDDRVAGGESGAVTDYVRKTWPDASADRKVGESSPVAVNDHPTVAEWLATLEEADFGQKDEETFWNELKVGAEPVGYTVPIAPEMSHSPTSVEFDSVDDALLAPMGESRDFRTPLEQIAREKIRAEEAEESATAASKRKRIKRVSLAEPVSHRESGHSEDGWWVVREETTDDDESAPWSDAEAMRRWVERIGDVTELISGSLASPREESQGPSDEEPSWSESQSWQPSMGPALPGDYLTDDRVPVYMNGAKWMREIAAMQLEQQF